MAENDATTEVVLNEQNFEVLVAKLVSTSQYVERSFQLLQNQFPGLRFKQVDKGFKQVSVKLDTIIERLDVKIDAGLRENRSMSIRLFFFAMVFSAISMAGMF